MLSTRILILPFTKSAPVPFKVRLNVGVVSEVPDKLVLIVDAASISTIGFVSSVVLYCENPVTVNVKVPTPEAAS